MIDVGIYKVRMTERSAVRLLDVLLHVGMVIRIDDLGVADVLDGRVVRLVVE